MYLFSIVDVNADFSSSHMNFVEKESTAASWINSTLSENKVNSDEERKLIKKIFKLQIESKSTKK